MVALLALGMATPARAGSLQIWASTVDNPPTSSDMVATGSSTAAAANPLTVGTFKITGLSAFSTSPGSPKSAEETGATTSITNTGGSTATLYITIGSTGFTAPVTPPDIKLESNIGGAVVIGNGANALTYQSYLDNVTPNGQNTLVGITPGAQHPGITAEGSYNNSTSTMITSLKSPYSLTEYFAITLGAGAEINFSSSTSLLVSAIPEPSSLTLAGLGVLGMIGYGLRRRKATGA
jgi:hypothetical protein